jgi:hypothetical protein
MRPSEMTADDVASAHRSHTTPTSNPRAIINSSGGTCGLEQLFTGQFRRPLRSGLRSP